jgi:hypothetical protein
MPCTAVKHVCINYQFLHLASMPIALLMLQRLLAHESLATSLQFVQIQQFFELTNRIWPEIVPPEHPPPASLPPLISDFLAAALKLDTNRVQLIWTAFGDLAEASHNETPQPSLDDVFRIHSRPCLTG